jgi:hypothetical protein
MRLPQVYDCQHRKSRRPLLGSHRASFSKGQNQECDSVRSVNSCTKLPSRDTFPFTALAVHDLPNIRYYMLNSTVSFRVDTYPFVWLTDSKSSAPAYLTRIGQTCDRECAAVERLMLSRRRAQ